MVVPISWIIGGIGGLAVAGAVGYGVWRVDQHFDEYSRLQQAEATLKGQVDLRTKERDEALMVNSSLVEENERAAMENAARLARLQGQAEAERRNAAAARTAMMGLRNAPGANDRMSPVLELAFEFVRQSRAGERAAAATDLRGNVRDTPAVPTVPGAAPGTAPTR